MNVIDEMDKKIERLGTINKKYEKHFGVSLCRMSETWEKRVRNIDKFDKEVDMAIKNNVHLEDEEQHPY